MFKLNKVLLILFAICIQVSCFSVEETEIVIPKSFEVEKSGLVFYPQTKFLNENGIFAQGDIKGDFVGAPDRYKRHFIWAPDDSILASASLYLSAPSYEQMYVLRDSEEQIIGFIGTHTPFLNIFKRITTILYNAEGIPVLETKFSLFGKNFKSYLPGQPNSAPVIETKSDFFGFRNWTINVSPKLNLDPRLILISLQVHLNSVTFVRPWYLHYYGLIEEQNNQEIKQDDTQDPTLVTNAQENIDFLAIQPWLAVLDILSEEKLPQLNDTIKEDALLQLAPYFETKDGEVNPQEILDNLPNFTSIEKAAIYEALNEKMKLLDESVQ